MNRDKCQQIRITALKAMNDALKPLGVTAVFAKTGRFDDTNFNLKVTFTEGKVLSQDEKAAADFLANCQHIGLKPTDLNRLTLMRGIRRGQMTVMQVCGLLPKGRDNIILVRTEAGKGYRVPLDEVVQGFALYDAQNKPTAPPPAKTTTGKKRDEREVLADIRRTMMDLEPENLSADGERPPAFVQKEKERLEGVLATLHTELGRVPSDSEVWNV